MNLNEPLLPPPPKDLTAVFRALHEANCTVADITVAILTEKRFKRSPRLAELLRQSEDVLKALISHSRLPTSAAKTACKAMHPLYAREIRFLVKSTTGWHFHAHKAMPEDIDDFDLGDLASDTADHAPLTSALLDSLLSAKKLFLQHSTSENTIDDLSNSDRDSVNEDQIALEGMSPSSPDQRKKTKCSERRATLLRIVRPTTLTAVPFNCLLEKDINIQYRDAKLVSESKYLPKHAGHLPSCLPNSRKSDRDTCAHGRISFNNDASQFYTIALHQCSAHSARVGTYYVCCNCI